MKSTIWKVSGSCPLGEAAGKALREAGIGLVEKNDWEEVWPRPSAGAKPSWWWRTRNRMSDLAGARNSRADLPMDVRRQLSHDLRTPLRRWRLAAPHRERVFSTRRAQARRGEDAIKHRAPGAHDRQY
jgi:hypothetical protein